MKVAVVSQYYAPEDARVPTQVSRELVKRGHAVQVITGFPSYPHGRVFAGFRRRLRHVEWSEGVRVRRVPAVVAHSQNPATRIASYLSFAFSSALTWREVRSADVVYVYATQMTAAIGPMIWRALGGPQYVLHVQDLWPESVTQSTLMRGAGVARLMEAALKPLLANAYRHAGGVIAIAPTMAELLIERGARPEGSTVVLNWAEERDNPTEYTAGVKARTSIVYAGNIGPLQDLELAVKAASALKELDGFSLTIFGSGVSERSLRELVRETGATNVRVHGRVPHDEMARVYAMSDFQLVTLRDMPIFRATIPSKVPASLYEGIPLVTNVAGDVASIVDTHGLGVTCEPGSVESLISAFRAAHELTPEQRDAASGRCREFYANNLSLEQGIDAVESTLQSAEIARGAR